MRKVVQNEKLIDILHTFAKDNLESKIRHKKSIKPKT